MKKKLLILLGVAVSVIIVCGVVYYLKLPEFQIFQSMAMSADNFRRDDVRVIVYNLNCAKISVDNPDTLIQAG